MTSFRNFHGLLGGFAIFISQNYQDMLVVWHRLAAQLLGQGPLGVNIQTGVQTASFWKVTTNLVGYVRPARGGDILVPAVGPGLTEFSQHLLVTSFKRFDWALAA